MTPLGRIFILFGVCFVLDGLCRAFLPSLEGVAFQVHWRTVLVVAIATGVSFAMQRMSR